MNVFSLFASIELDDKGYNRSLDNAERNTDKFSNNAQRAFDRVGKSAIALGTSLSRNVTAPIAAVTTAAVAGAVKLGNYADRILDLSQITGLSTDTLQAFEQVAIEAGVSVDTLANSARMLTTRLSATGNESLEFSDAMAAIGVSTTDADGNLRSMDQLMPDLLQGLSGMQDITARNALAMDIFGRSAADILPVLGLGSDRIDELMESAVEMGLVLDGDALDAANAFRIVQEQLRNRLNLVYREINVALIPIMTQLTTFLLQRAVPAFRNIIDRVVSAIEFFNGLSDGVKSMVAVVVSAFAAAGPVVMAVGIVTRAFATLLTPWGLIAAAVAGFVAAYQTNFLGLRDITEPVVTFIVDALGKVITIGRNIVSNWTTVSRGFSLIISSMGELAGSVARLIGAQFNLMRVGVEETFIALGRGIASTLAIIVNGVIGQFNLVIAGLNRLGAEIDPIQLLDPAGFDEITSDLTANIGAAQEAVADARRDIGVNFGNMVGAAVEFYNMITDDTPAIVEGIESTGEAATTAAAAVTPAFGNEIPTAFDETTAAIDRMDAATRRAMRNKQEFQRMMSEVVDLVAPEPVLGGATPRDLVPPEIIVTIDEQLQARLEREEDRRLRVEETQAQRQAAWNIERQNLFDWNNANAEFNAGVDRLSEQLTARAERGDGGLSDIPGVTFLQQAAESAGQFLGELGARASNVAQRSFPLLANAMQAFATGGPMAALASIFMDLIGRTEGFQRLIEAVNALLDPLVSALEPLLNAVVSVVEALEPLFQIIGQLIEVAFAPLTFILEKVVAPVFTWIAEGLRAVYNALFGWLFGRIERDNRRMNEAEQRQQGSFSDLETPTGPGTAPMPGDSNQLRTYLAAASGDNMVMYWLDTGEFVFSGPGQGTQNEAGINTRLSLLRRLKTFATTPNQRRAIEAEIGVYENLAASLDRPRGELGIDDTWAGGGDSLPLDGPPETPEYSPRFDSMTPRQAGASIGRLPTGVQLAVAVPLLDAANAFGSHVSSFGGYVDRLVTEGIAINTGTAGRTAALR